MTSPTRLAVFSDPVVTQPQQLHEHDRALLKRIRERGDTAALGELFIRYADRIVRAISRNKYCGSDRVRDAVIDAFIDLYTNPNGKTYAIDVGNDRALFTWLYRRIWRKTCQYLAGDRRCLSLDDHLYKEPERRYSYEYLLALRQALRKISVEMPDHFRILQLIMWDGCDAAAAAARLAAEKIEEGKDAKPYSDGAIGRMKHEIIERLREELHVTLGQDDYRGKCLRNYTDWL